MATNNKFNKKPVYKKNKKPTTPKSPITSKDVQDKKNLEPKIVEPSEKYLETIRCIKRKGFFVDSRNGGRIMFKDIIEFHVKDKDIPVVIIQTSSKSKYGGISIVKKVYNIVRYNPEEIIGRVTKNINPWMLPLVNLDMLSD